MSQLFAFQSYVLRALSLINYTIQPSQLGEGAQHAHLANRFSVIITHLYAEIISRGVGRRKGFAHLYGNVTLIFIQLVFPFQVTKLFIVQVIADPDGNTMIVHANIERAALGVVEGTKHTENIRRLLRYIVFHVVFRRINNARFELGANVLTPYRLPLFSSTDVQQFVDVADDLFVCLTKVVAAQQSGGHHDRCQLAYQRALALMRAFEQTTFAVDSIEATEHVEHADIFAQMTICHCARGTISVDLLPVPFIESMIDGVKL